VVKLGIGELCSDEISGYVCAKCGDGICGKGENVCNCAQDCAQGADSEVAKAMTCDQACKSLGYQSSYCNVFTWKQTSANPDAFTPAGGTCLKGDDQMQSYRINVSDCVNRDLDTNRITAGSQGRQCCCKGEPLNASTCPKINWPNGSTDCIEESGWMKNPKSGECCWYRAMCYGPENWEQYKTKEECQNPCALDQGKQTCCRSGVCEKVTLNCGITNKVDSDWMACDSQCKPFAECKPKNDVWDSCDALCQKNGLGKVTDCIAGVGRSIINPDNGFGCCCEKTVCAPEGEKADTIKGQQCCAGLKNISDLSSGGIDSLCINPAHQKADSICTFDEDCAPGLKCKRFSGAASGQDMNSHCVNLNNQKEGADCIFDDDCATGYTCQMNMANGSKKCTNKSIAPITGSPDNGFNGLNTSSNSLTNSLKNLGVCSKTDKGCCLSDGTCSNQGCDPGQKFAIESCDANCVPVGECVGTVLTPSQQVTACDQACKQAGRVSGTCLDPMAANSLTNYFPLMERDKVCVLPQSCYCKQTADNGVFSADADARCAATGGTWYSSGSGCSCPYGKTWASDTEGCLAVPLPCAQTGIIMTQIDRECCAGLVKVEGPVGFTASAPFLCQKSCAKTSFY
jgi:hypothetical protein